MVQWLTQTLQSEFMTLASAIVAFGRSLNLPEPQFPHQEKGDITYLMGTLQSSVQWWLLPLGSR